MNKRNLLAGLAGLLLPVLALGQTYNRFAPANGILVGDPSTYVTTAADSADIIAEWSGVCSSSTYLRGDGTCAAAAPPAAALTKVDDTNVTLTLGGTPTTALLQATSLTLGWTGTLAASRGGLGMSTVTDDTIAVANGTIWQSKAVPDCDTATSVLQYDTATNAFSCATAGVSFANPSATIGLSATNGVATTAMRSDAAPALSQAIAPTWTGAHVFTSVGGTNSAALAATNAQPTFIWDESDQSTNGRVWYARSAGGLFSIGLCDGPTVTSCTNEFAITRSGATATALSFGDATNNPTYTMLGTGLTTLGGSLQINGDHAGINSTDSYYELRESDQGADGKVWWTRANSGNYTIATRTDALGVGGNAFAATRSGSSVTGVEFGNATNNPTFTFLGSGTFTVNSSAANMAVSTTTFNSGATANSMLVTSSHASGPYMTWQRGGVSTADMGNGKQCGSGFTLDSLGLCARSGNPLQMAAGGRTSPDISIAAAGAISLNQATTVAGTSAPLRLVAADSLGDNYVQFYSSDGSTSRGFIGNGSGASNEFQVSNDVASGNLQLLTNGGTTYVGPSNSTAANFSVGINSSLLGTSSRGTVTINGVTDSYVAFGVNGGLSGYIGTPNTSSMDLYSNTGRALNFYTNGGSLRASIASGGGMTVGSPTGGNQGNGTINATGLYINGVSVEGGTTTTSTFSATFTGFSSAPSCTVKYRKTGSQVSFFVNAGSTCTGTSNSTSWTISNLPAAITPASNATVMGVCTDNGNDIPCAAAFTSSSTVIFYAGNPLLSTGFTSSGTKGFTSGVFNYDLRN